MWVIPSAGAVRSRIYIPHELTGCFHWNGLLSALTFEYYESTSIECLCHISSSLVVKDLLWWQILETNVREWVSSHPGLDVLDPHIWLYWTTQTQMNESHSVVSDSLQQHGLYSPWILQARILEWVAFPFSRDLPNPGIEPGRIKVYQKPDGRKLP